MYDIYPPRSEQLSAYISEFTILRKKQFKPVNYFAFPHSVSSIAFYSGVRIDQSDHGIVITQAAESSPLVIVLGKYLQPFHLRYLDGIDEIAINFKPTGINYFFEESHAQIAGMPFQFLENETWQGFSQELAQLPESKRIEALEHFLLSQLKDKDLGKVEQVVDLIHQDLSISIKDLASRVGVSERTINRLFHTHLGCSPRAYKRILRFRSSVQMNSQEMNLTELCFNNEYYDSPHFTREFKKLTARNPRDFFNLSTMAGEKFPYIFR